MSLRMLLAAGTLLALPCVCDAQSLEEFVLPDGETPSEELPEDFDFEPGDDLDDLEELSLEELLNVELTSMTALGIHHTHLKGEWMLGYHFMFMEMIGNRTENRRLTTDQVLQDFMVTPTRMSMEMHMLHGMYAPTDDLTLMAMIPYLLHSMDHVTRTGGRFTTESEGFGDLKVAALYTFYRSGPHRVHFHGGLSFPTGSIDETDDTPAGPDQKLPYPMQLGSGTVDFRPQVAYIGQEGSWAWGADLGGVIRIGRNSNDYSLGDRFEARGWLGYRWTDWLATYMAVVGEVWANIDGADPDLNPFLVPTADAKRRAGERVQVSFGVNVFQRKGILEGHRVSVELGVPVYQFLDGPQLENDWQVSVAWQWTFF